jgi:hypothetical protein
MDQKELTALLIEAFKKIEVFADGLSDIRLRHYQVRVAEAIIQSVRSDQGNSFVVIFPRQSGKNEVQAVIEAYLLGLYQLSQAEIVKISPTWKPQSQNAMRRLERVLQANSLLFDRWSKEQGYIYRVGSARIFFLSGSPTTNIVGATASTLLECDEAQDVTTSKWDKEVNPMAASTNATRVFWGTAWTNRTLLARERRAAEAAQAADGIRRVFVMRAEDVAAEVPAYGQFVAAEVAKLGRNHPFVKTQYFSEEIDAEGGMFPAARQAIMQGDHAPAAAPEGGVLYAFLLDLAGEDEGAADESEGTGAVDLLRNPGRDAAALTIVEVDLSSLADPIIQAPTYKVVSRRQWVGTRHVNLYGQLKGLGELWKPRYWVVDATGVGAGLTGFLDAAFPDKVIPFMFNQSTKSRLGWAFLAVVESGRFKTFHREVPVKSTGAKNAKVGLSKAEESQLQDLFFEQLNYCQHEILPGPERRMRWGVPDGTRNPATGELVHDDLIISAALAAELDGQVWPAGGPALVVRALDPLDDMTEF